MCNLLIILQLVIPLYVKAAGATPDQFPNQKPVISNSASVFPPLPWFWDNCGTNNHCLYKDPDDYRLERKSKVPAQLNHQKARSCRSQENNQGPEWEKPKIPDLIAESLWNLKFCLHLVFQTARYAQTLPPFLKHLPQNW